VSRPDLDALLNALLPFAQQMVQKRGSFIPFGASMPVSGEISVVMGDVGKQHPDSQEMIDFLTATFRDQAVTAQIKAIGVCLDVRAVPPGQTEKTDAILARLEHQDGEAVDVYLPYRKGLLGKVKYGEIFASKGTPQVFAGAG
jgi:hypothetical protein